MIMVMQSHNIKNTLDTYLTFSWLEKPNTIINAISMTMMMMMIKIKRFMLRLETILSKMKCLGWNCSSASNEYIRMNNNTNYSNGYPSNKHDIIQ